MRILPAEALGSSICDVSRMSITGSQTSISRSTASARLLVQVFLFFFWIFFIQFWHGKSKHTKNILTTITCEIVIVRNMSNNVFTGPGVDENHSKGAFCSCASATSSIMEKNMCALIRLSPSDVTRRRDYV